MNTTIRDYKDLKVWQVAMELAVATYRLAATLPRDERFGLSAQMRRCAVSIPSNIAEGYARRSPKDYLRFLGISDGSVKELETQALLAERLELIVPAANEDVLRLCSSTSRMLTALRRRLS